MASRLLYCTRMNAFGTLQSHRPFLFARAIRLTRDPSRADDLVQDTLVRAMMFSASFQEGTSIKAWLSQIMFSVFVTNYRKSKREYAAYARLSNDPTAWVFDSVFAESEQNSGLTKAVTQTLTELPVAFRLVVEKVVLAGESYRDTAEALEIPVGTAMSRLHRARKILSSRLQLPIAA